MQPSISDYPVKWCGENFTLRATNGALMQIERRLNAPYPSVFERLASPPPRLTDTLEVFAAFALPHGKHTAEGLASIMPLDEGETLVEAWKAIQGAIAAARAPSKPKAQAEATDDSARPPQ